MQRLDKELCAVQWLCLNLTWVPADFWVQPQFFSWHLRQALLEVHEYAKLESFIFLAQFQQLCPRPLYHAFPSRWAVLNFVQLKKVVLLPWRGTSAHELVVVCQQLCDVGCSQFCVRHNAHPTALSPLPSLPPSSLHPLSANSSPHITTRSSELPPTPPYFSVGIFQMDLCSTCTHLLDVSVSSLYISASWKVYFLNNAFESNVVRLSVLFGALQNVWK